MIDDKTHKEMLSFYHKKQEEQKELVNNDEDAYLNSVWADNKGLKT